MQAPAVHPNIIRSRATSVRDLRDLVGRHRLLSYVLVAYVVSWSYWIALAMTGLVVTPGGATSHVPGLFGPMIAAFLVTVMADGRSSASELAGRLIRWRTSPRWYALALVPVGLFLVGVGLVAVTGGAVPSLADLASYSGIPDIGLPAVVLIAFLGSVGEETGWRGVAQSTLRRDHSLLAASLGVAAIWALWHVPLFSIIDTYRQMGLGLVPMFVLGLGSGAIVFGWLYERSGGSILIVALAHLGLNLGSATTASHGLPQALVMTGIIVWATFIVAGEARRAGGLGRATAGIWRSVMVGILRSRVGHGLGRSVTIVSYRGRTSGRRLATPVEYSRRGSQVTILVANADRKQWWRNVRADGDVTLWIDGGERRGTAAVLTGSEAAEALVGYVATRPRAAQAAEVGAVVIGVELSDVAR